MPCAMSAPFLTHGPGGPPVNGAAAGTTADVTFPDPSTWDKYTGEIKKGVPHGKGKAASREGERCWVGLT